MSFFFSYFLFCFFFFKLFLFLCFFFFFFQAEDGIRDGRVTGVQTCALPICPRGRRRNRGASVDRRRLEEPRRHDQAPRRERARLAPPRRARRPPPRRPGRSEERRVGKECRSRWSPDHEKKKRRGQRQTSRDG